MDNALGPQVRVFGTGGHKELQDFLYTCSLSVQLNSCSFKLKHAGEEVKKSVHGVMYHTSPCE